MNTLSKLKVAVASVILSGGASAGVITDWTYLNEAGFSSWTSTIDSDMTGGIDGVNAVVGTNTVLAGTAVELEWGTPYYPTDPSSFEINTPVAGAVETGGGYVEGTDLIHNNWVIFSSSPYLTTATMLDALILTPTEVDNGATPLPAGLTSLPAPQLTFNIDFYETPNQYNLATDEAYDVVCPNGEQNGEGVNVNGCGDIFVISSDDDNLEFSFVDGALLLTTSFSFNGTPFEAELGGWVYQLTTRLTGVEFLTDEGCAAVGEEAGCVGFVTEEETVNTLQAEFQIVAVPEPGTLAAFGLGLLGLAGFARRRKA